MMNSLRKLCAVVATFAVMSGGAFAAEEQHKHKEPAAANPSGDTGRHEPGMHMHKSDITHSSAGAAEFKGEAAQLRAQAESHRKLAKMYRSGKPAKGMANYESVAKHCDALAKAYEDAAKAAEGAAAELAK